MPVEIGLHQLVRGQRDTASNSASITLVDFGPWIWTGETSGSPISTSRPELTATPLAHSSRSLSEVESQKWFSASRSSTGSLTIPPDRERDQRVAAAADRALGQVARGQHVGERERVRAGDLDLALGGDVPQRDVVDQLPVRLQRVAAVAAG